MSAYDLKQTSARPDRTEDNADFSPEKNPDPVRDADSPI